MTDDEVLAFVRKARVLIDEYRRKGINPGIALPTGEVCSLLDEEQAQLLDDMEMLARLSKQRARRHT
jgi:hypothetical protein